MRKFCLFLLVLWSLMSVTKSSVFSDSRATSVIKKCLRYSRHEGQSWSGLLIAHGRIASVYLRFRIILMYLLRTHNTVKGDCKREGQVETRTSWPTPVKVWYPWRCKWEKRAPLEWQWEKRAHLEWLWEKKIHWEMLIIAVHSELQHISSLGGLWPCIILWEATIEEKAFIWKCQNSY